MNWEYFLDIKKQRFLSMLYLLEKHPCTLKELMDYNYVCEKTAKRDLTELSEQFGFRFTEGKFITWENPISYSKIRKRFLDESAEVQLLISFLTEPEEQPDRYLVRKLNRLITDWDIKIVYRLGRLSGNQLVINRLKKLLLYDEAQSELEIVWKDEWRYLLADNTPFARYYKKDQPFKAQGYLFLEKQLEVAADPAADLEEYIEPKVLVQVEKTVELIQRYFGESPSFLYEEMFRRLLSFYLQARLALPLEFIRFQFERRSMRTRYPLSDYRRIAEIVHKQKLWPCTSQTEVEIAKIFFYIIEPMIPRVQKSTIRIGLSIKGSESRVYSLQHYLQNLFQNILPVKIGIAKENVEKAYDLVITNHHHHSEQQNLLYFEQVSEKDIALVLYKRLLNQH